MQMIDSETQDVVDREGTVMGYEFEKGKYVTVENEELDKLKIESSDVIDIELLYDNAMVAVNYQLPPYSVFSIDPGANISRSWPTSSIISLG